MGQRVGSVPTLEPGEVQGVVDAVAEVQPFWAQPSLDDRARYMRRTAQVIIDSLDELSLLLAREQGKPRTRGLHDGAADDRRPALDRRQRPEDPVRPQDPLPADLLEDEEVLVAFEPLGVVGVIAPWNYLWSIPFGEVAIALMCGNGVLKPASLTLLVGERIQRVFERAGIPEGLRARCTAAAAWATRWSRRRPPACSSRARSTSAARWRRGR